MHFLFSLLLSFFTFFAPLDAAQIKVTLPEGEGWELEEEEYTETGSFVEFWLKDQNEDEFVLLLSAPNHEEETLDQFLNFDELEWDAEVITYEKSENSALVGAISEGEGIYFVKAMRTPGQFHLANYCFEGEDTASVNKEKMLEMIKNATVTEPQPKFALTLPDEWKSLVQQSKDNGKFFGVWSNPRNERIIVVVAPDEKSTIDEAIAAYSDLNAKVLEKTEDTIILSWKTEGFDCDPEEVFVTKIVLTPHFYHSITYAYHAEDASSVDLEKWIAFLKETHLIR